ncbi:MAG TPA: AmmeMemoRadiSam system radical SAM enzyme, partial [Phycisphaerales bacterium]|nr:AmmeMemoRadiSam system radical SAM enzyme [Phycisphaerales bacterium]
MSLKEAVLWEVADGGKVRCALCSWRCVIGDGKVGRCHVRKNIAGRLYSLNYDKVCAANADPIEKKPLFHFQPGSRSYSIAAGGCNFRCEFCQNWSISQTDEAECGLVGEAISPERIVAGAVRGRCSSIAYTYTEPTVFMELCAECGVLARGQGLKNVFVSNGYMTREAIDFAAEWLDAINVDLKAFTEDYYGRLCHARLQPVLETIEYIARHTGIWMELTTLLVPGENDGEDELKRLAGFIVDKAGPDVPWHVSRFYPQYKYTDADATPTSSLELAYNVGRAAGLRYVYVGNVPG